MNIDPTTAGLVILGFFGVFLAYRFYQSNKKPKGGSPDKPGDGIPREHK